jgi:hypothetical protein
MKQNRLICFIIFISVTMLSAYRVSWADPSSLIIVRDTTGQLYKRTCTGLTCTPFVTFPGNFGSQPTVYWDEDIQLYVVWGRASSGDIYRSTFSRTGNFNNDWVPVGGSTPSPVAAAGGGIVNTFNAINGSMTPVTLSTTVVNLHSLGMNVPYDGFVVCHASGSVAHYRTSTGSNAYARLYLTTTSGGTAPQWNFTDVPAGTPTGYTSFPFSVQRWWSVSPGSHNYYLTGEASGSGTTTSVYNAGLACNYYPYAF